MYLTWLTSGYTVRNSNHLLISMNLLVAKDKQMATELFFDPG
jgi:hypothetical protein